MNKPLHVHGGARLGSGRKGRFKEPTKPVRIPISKLPAVFELLENVHNQDQIEEYSLIDSFLFWLANEKGIYLCEWCEGIDMDGVKIPKGFIKFRSGNQAIFEEYKGPI